MKRLFMFLPLLALVLLVGCPDPFIHDPAVVSVKHMPVVEQVGAAAPAIPLSEAPADYYMYNNRFYIVIDERDTVYKDDWSGLREDVRLAYRGLNPLPDFIAAHRIAGSNQYKRYRHYEDCQTGPRYEKPSWRRALPPILIPGDKKE